MTIDYSPERKGMRDDFKAGIMPADTRQPISDELAIEMIQELKDKIVILRKA